MAFLLISFNHLSYSQALKKPINEMTKEDVLELSYEELLIIPFEDLIKLAEKLGLSVDEMLNIKLSVSKSALSIREQPSIVSVVSGEEIQNSGANDLFDVLRLIPGFYFTYDTEGIVGIALRGSYGNEGKVLLLIDGIEINEQFYSTLQFGNHYPIENIKRIEIIRGPGSAIYGGCAELGVINILTKSGKDINGFRVGGVYSFMKETYGRRNISVAAGKKINDFDFSVEGTMSEFNRSEITGYSIYGDTLHKDDYYSINRYANLSLNYKGLQSRFIVDEYKMRSVLEIPYWNEFHNYYGELKYDFVISEKMTLTQKVSFKHQVPWYMEGYFGNKYINRTVGGLGLSYQINKNLDLIAGAEYQYDYGKFTNPDPDTTIYFYNGKPDIIFKNIVGYGQFVWRNRIVNLTIGGRFEHHDQYGSAFAPRIGLNKIINNFHFKLLYSQGYRSPNIGNIRFNPHIKPETTNVLELETGMKISNKQFVTVNFFDITNKKTLVWYDSLVVFGYENFGKSGTRGVEIDYNLKYNKINLNMNYSYYTAQDKNTIEYYAVPDKNDYLLAAPKHKFALRGNFQLGSDLFLNASAVYWTKQYAYAVIDEGGNLILNEHDPDFLLNFHITWNNAFFEGIQLRAGVNNVMDDKFRYAQAYQGSEPSYPGASREWVFSIRYELKRNVVFKLL
jgi:outer membrane receptor for ferrienterochelin and colicin